jgi:hypothetical protein
MGFLLKGMILQPKSTVMKYTAILATCFCMLLGHAVFSQAAGKRKITIQKTSANFKIDGLLNEDGWKNAPVADKFICNQPTPFKPESPDNPTLVYFLYNNDGIYIGGYLHEKVRDSIASELTGRDGFGNNDFIGIIFDTYQDKQNGFEYFVTPLGEQWDAKTSPNNEDFSWNAVWQSASSINKDGWSFEMFIPFSAIRFGKKKVQDWGLNIVRQRRKCGEKSFWQPIDPNINGFLTQEGLMTGLEDIKPPLRLQLSPYFSTYQNHDPFPEEGNKKNSTSFNGGVDIKYGINQAMTLDMTLIPDFGQVQTDNRVLNLSPFEQQFSENRTFFTEGAELFSKGNLFYSRRIGRIGAAPLHYYEVPNQLSPTESIIRNPEEVKLINATKISGRTQKGLGIGILNAITKPQHAVIFNAATSKERKYETDPLTNYNVIVLDQTLKHNSSVSFVNTNVWRRGKDYDANVSSALFDLYDKKNVWNAGGNISISKLSGINNKTITGYAHSIYFGKTSGHFTFNIWQDLTNDKYDKSDLAYFTNNNTMDQGIWAGYNWNKPRKWYNQVRVNTNFWISRLVTPIDALKRKALMFQGAGINFNGNAQLKNLWWVGVNINGGPGGNDFYEPRTPLQYGRVFRNKSRVGLNAYWNSNESKKLSWGGNIFIGTGGVFNRKNFDYGLFGKIRVSSKFSIDHSISVENARNQSGWADILYHGNSPDTVIFSRRNVNTVENVFAVKYNFSNKMGLTFRARHYWRKVDPKEFYELNKTGDLQPTTSPYTKNRAQNYNFFSADLVYNWQFAQGSFISIVWKDISETFSRSFEKNYAGNFNKIISQPQFNSLSLRVIYFLDYLTAKKSLSRTKVS